jgi:PEP-CTERM motif
LEIRFSVPTQLNDLEEKMSVNRPAILQTLVSVVICTFSCVFSAQSAVIYTFVGAPLIAQTSDVLFPEVTTYPPAAQPPLYAASLSFAAPLAFGATTAINAEFGGFDLVGGASQGGVLAFSADADLPAFGALPIRSAPLDIYTAATLGDEVHLFKYTTVEGSITTDAAGNISEWALDFIRHSVADDDAIVCTGLACVPSVELTTQDLVLSITSGPSQDRNLPHVALNGVAADGSLDISFVDTAFGDTGAIQDRSFSGGPGSWTVTGTPVPEPGTLALMLFVGLGFAAARRR